MSRIVPILILACVAAIGATAYAMLSANGNNQVAVPTSTPASATKGSDVQALTDARRTCTREAFDPLIERLRKQVAEAPKNKDGWRRLADGLLQRAQQSSHLLGLRVGHPIYDDLPQNVAADIDEAEAAVARARELGDDSGELFRISAEVMSQQITGITSALQWNGKIKKAIDAATRRGKDDPLLHLVLGMRSLMAPRFFGHDPEKALEHFAYAADALPADERPALFAGMASHLLKKRLDAIDWLERAVERNPGNVFARVALARVRRGEETPFGRDVTADEADASAPGQRR